MPSSCRVKASALSSLWSHSHFTLNPFSSENPPGVPSVVRSGVKFCLYEQVLTACPSTVGIGYTLASQPPSRIAPTGPETTQVVSGIGDSAVLTVTKNNPAAPYGQPTLDVRYGDLIIRIEASDPFCMPLTKAVAGEESTARLALRDI